MSLATRLEQYTLKKRPLEVLLVSVEMEGEIDQIAIFKGFSSSLMHSTNFDPDVPVLPDDATILTIDRLVAPYNPDAPQFIEQGIIWEQMTTLLNELGV